MFDNNSHKASVIAGTWQIRKLTGGTSFLSQPLSGKYVWVGDDIVPENQGFYRIRRALDANTLEVDRPTAFVASTKQFNAAIYDYHYTPEAAPSKPLLSLPHAYIVKDTLQLNGVRAVDVDETYLEGGALEEDVDYTVNYDTGQITLLVPVEPDVIVSANYSWLLETKTDTVSRAAAWVSGALYGEGTPVLNPYGNYVRATDTHYSGGAYAADLRHWVDFENPITQNVAIPTQELGAWIPDAEIEEERLYNNFGFLLGIKQPSSENYRALLEGLAQLFLLGPTFSHLESALNVMAGYPLVRDDGEIIQSVDTGVVASGEAGVLVDVQHGRNGTLLATGSFVVTNGNFKADDAANSIVRINRSTYNDYDFVVSTVVSSNEVTLSPYPFVNETDTGFYWTHEHATSRKLFSTTEFNFSVSDVGGYIAISSAEHEKNLGTYLIEDFVNANTVVLRSERGFYDEPNLSWQFTRTNEQHVSTNLRTYKIPFGIPLKEFIPGQVLEAFDALTDVFTVVDYIVTPTWWHSQVIPRKLLELTNNDAGRRHATPILIRNETGPLDSARIGDPGVIVGADDEGRAAAVRTSEARWMGGDELYFAVPQITSEDIGQYITIVQTPSDAWEPNTVYAVDARVHYGGDDYRCTTAHTSSTTFNGLNWTGYYIQIFVGSYRIAAVSTDGVRVRLEDFPTVAMLTEGVIPDGTRLLAEDVHLPARLYRRTVGFVIMDKFLKYHTMQVKINAYSGLTPEFISTIAGTLQDARPNYTYLFVNPIAQFTERLEFSDVFSLLVS